MTELTVINSGDTNYIRADASGVIQVSISDSPEAIPLKDLANRLEEYLSRYGGQEAIRIQIIYVDENGDYQEWKP